MKSLRRQDHSVSIRSPLSVPSSLTRLLTPSRKASTASPPPRGTPPPRMNPPFSTGILRASLILGKPPSLRATVKLPRLCVNWGECSTFLRILFFCDRSSDCMAACATSGLVSAADTSSMSCASRSNAGGRKLNRWSTVPESADSTSGSVEEGGRRSGRVVKCLSGPCGGGTRWFPWRDLRNSCTTADGSDAAAALL